MAQQSYVRVAADSTGKYIRNQSLYVPVDLFDGTGPAPVLVQQQVVMQADEFGKVANPDAHELLSALLQLTIEMRDSLAMLTGADALGSDTTPEPPFLLGLSGLPPARVDPYNPVRAMGDRFGRQVMVVNGLREQVGTQATTLSATTSETTIVTAQPGQFADLVALIVSNTSAATSTRIDIRDTTAGSVLFSLQSVGGGAPCGFALPVPVPQTTQNTNWTAQCGTSTTDVRIYAVYMKNR